MTLFFKILKVGGIILPPKWANLDPRNYEGDSILVKRE